MRTIGTIRAQRVRIIILEEVEVMVDIGKLFTRDLRSHEVGKDLLRPHIIEPAHRNEVAKPHVGSLMGDKVQANHFFIWSRIRSKKDLAIRKLDSSRMLHATKLITRQDNESILLKRERNAGVLFEPTERQSSLIEAFV